VSTYGDILVVTAVDVTAGTGLAQSTGGNVAEGQETAVAVLAADNRLARLADLALIGATGNGGSSESQSDENELHFEGWR
jgi:hypothetical protein